MHNITYTGDRISIELLQKVGAAFPMLRWWTDTSIFPLAARPGVCGEYLNFDKHKLFAPCFADGRNISDLQEFLQLIGEDLGVAMQPSLGQVICDPDSEEAKALIGKKVLFSDSYSVLAKAIDSSSSYVAEGVLDEIVSDIGKLCRFQKSSGMCWAFIKALPEPPVEETQEVTMEEVCAKFGKNVKIKKGE